MSSGLSSRQLFFFLKIASILVLRLKNAITYQAAIGFPEYVH